jgi:polyribonucleotide nucleotidyltransferase
VTAAKLDIEVGGRKLSIETGRIARQAHGAVVMRLGDTVVMVTACAQKKPREGVDFLPLTVDYRENTYAAGKIPGGFFKREGRPNDKETLTSRLIDRPLRPLFPKGWNCETQVIALVLSADIENDPDILGVTGASAALFISEIPFDRPIAAVRVGLVDGRYVINPTTTELATSRLDLVVAGTADAVVMVEAGAREVSENEALSAIYAAHEEIKKIVALQHTLREMVGRPKRAFTAPEVDHAFEKDLVAKWRGKLTEAMQIKGKLESYATVDKVLEAIVAEVPAEDLPRRKMAVGIFHEMQNTILHEEALSQGRRLDGRRFDEIRSITCEVGVLPRTHGSALFTRGETQALVTTTLGTSSDAQIIDWMEERTEKRFMLHYNFPPFSVGEVKFLRGPGRREIGHGNLAERALRPMIPSNEDFPYTVRQVSDILESNGSSSMASVCGGALSLMDAGVPMKSSVAGIAMGLVMEGDKFAVLSDIAGAEDHHGDMDFKVAGTRTGITALQMDIKVAGVTRPVMEKALEQARAGRMFILEVMEKTLATHRGEISNFAPRIITIRIPKDKIREVIGPGGKTIRSIVERTGAKIDIDDDGRVDIASIDETSAQKAVEIIRELTAEAELGKIYVGKVVRVVNFGAFVEILPGVEGLVHISEISDQRIREVKDEINEGDEVLVKVIDIDAQGRVRLSRKAAMKEGSKKIS